MKITPLKMWVQNVLPVVYDDSLSYYEMVGKINEKTNEIITQVNENTDAIEALNEIIEQLGNVDELKALLEQVETIINDLYTTDIPAMDSENGSAGVANHAARSDHSHPSDTSKADVSLGIDGALAGQYVKIKTVEAGVPTEFENGAPHEIPSGGTTGQALRKESNGDYAADWSDVHEVPSGGNANDIFVKNSNSNYDTKWTNTPEQMSAFAYINRNATQADRAYQAGDYLVFNGALYRVKDNTTIGEGVALSPGNNIILTNATNEIIRNKYKLVRRTKVYSGISGAARTNVNLSSDYAGDLGTSNFTNIVTLYAMSDSGMGGAIWQVFLNDNNSIYIKADQAFTNATVALCSYCTD